MSRNLQWAIFSFICHKTDILPNTQLFYRRCFYRNAAVRYEAYMELPGYFL